ncbi:MAG: hypothetical protein HND47_07780 [Chloroflexi bacterium]|nr:hypothetical protein [Chloroflexota bacterium]
MTERQPDDEGDVRNIQRLVAFLGVFILLLSQFLVFSQPVVEDVLLPPYAPLGIAGVIVLILSQLIRPTPFWSRLARKRFFGDRAFWIFGGALFSLLAAGATAFFMTFTRVNYIPVVTVWLLGAASYVYAFVKSDSTLSIGSLTDWVKAHRAEILSVLIVMVFAAAVRFYRLGGIPRVLDGDEGAVGLQAQLTAGGALSNPFASWENFGGLYLQLINLSMNFFGAGALGLRVLPAIAGVLAVPAVYLLRGRSAGVGLP